MVEGGRVYDMTNLCIWLGHATIVALLGHNPQTDKIKEMPCDETTFSFLDHASLTAKYSLTIST